MRGKILNINSTHIIRGNTINLMIIDVVLLKLNCYAKGEWQFSAASFVFSMFILPYALGQLNLSVPFLILLMNKQTHSKSDGCHGLRDPQVQGVPKQSVGSLPFYHETGERTLVITQSLFYCHIMKCVVCPTPSSHL